MTNLKTRMMTLVFVLPLLMTAMCEIEEPYCRDYECVNDDYPVCYTTGTLCRGCGNEPVQSCCDRAYTYCWYEVCGRAFDCYGIECSQAALNVAGFCSAVECGNGICEDGEDSYSCPEDCTAIITLEITDMFNDGEDIAFKFYDEDNLLVWPSASSFYLTPGYGIPASNDLTCIVGDLICFGAETFDFYWGVGLNNEYDCEDCCVVCEQDLFQEWSLY